MGKSSRILSVVLAVFLVCTMVTPAFAASYPDVNGHWASDAIARWSDYMVIQGDGTNFRPDDFVTRAETATILDNLIGYVDVAGNTYEDVDSDAWYATPILKAVAAGVMQGDGNGIIRPNDSITREEAAVMFARAFGIQTGDQASLSYQDADEISDWAKSTVSKMSSLDYINGYDGQFRPQDPITRAEIVTIMDNMVGLYLPDGGTYVGNYGNKIAVIKSPNTILTGVTVGGVVISPKVGDGSVSLIGNTQINGNLTNLAPDAAIKTTGSTVDSSTGIDTESGSGNVNIGGGGTTTTTYSVRFDGNGGSWDNDSYRRITYTRNQRLSVKAPSDPKRSGYTFEGWFSSKNAAETLDMDEIVDLDTRVTRSMTIYAGWDEIETTPDKSVYGFEIQKPDTLTAGVEADIQATLKATEVGLEGYSNVLLKISAVTPEGGSVQLLAVDSAGDTFDLIQTGQWGPDGGFAIAKDHEETLPLKAIFSMAGTYQITTNLVDVLNENEVLATNTTTYEVTAPGKSVYGFEIQKPDTLTAGVEADIQATLKADVVGLEGYSNVLLKISAVTPEGGSVQLLAVDSAGDTFDLIQTGQWGPDGGFAIAANHQETLPLKATFSTAGTYQITTNLVDVLNENQVLATNTTTYEVTAAEKSDYGFEVKGPETLVAGEQAEAEATLKATDIKGEGYTNVLIKVSAVVPEGGSVELLAVDSTGTTYDLIKTGQWGPDGGFPIDKDYNVTTPLKVTFSKAGTYQITMTLVDVADGNKVLATSTQTFEVGESEKSDYGFEVKGPETLVAGEQAEAEATLKATDIKGEGYTNVLIKVSAVVPEGGSVELLAVDSTGTTYDLIKTGQWGPDGGFPIDKDYNVTTPLKVTFSKAGTYQITMTLVDVADGNKVLATSTQTYVVEQKEIPKWNGTDKTEVIPVEGVYSASTPAELAWIVEKINDQTLPSNIQIELTSDMDLDGHEWTPLGNAVRDGGDFSQDATVFSGVFDGKNHTIYGLKISNDPQNADQGVGLFSAVSGEGAAVKNLVLDGVDINLENNEATGAVAGIISGGAVVDNCTVKGTITSGRGVGGVVGRGLANATISNCENYANVTGKLADGNVGGIAGAMYYVGTTDTLKVSGCKNYGNVTGGTATAGIVGLMTTGSVVDCENSGTVISTTGTSIGGIVGELKAGGLIQGCSNTADVSGNGGGVGGVVGWIRYTDEAAYASTTGIAKVTGCENSGNVTVKDNYSVGGIMGMVYNAAEVEKCVNKGNVSGTGTAYMIGGVVGNVQFFEGYPHYDERMVKFIDCENQATSITQEKQPADGMTNTIIGHYSEVDKVLFQNCTSVEIDGMETGIKPPVAQVTTLDQLKSALDSEVIQTIVVKNNITLEDGTYGSADPQSRKTIEMQASFVLPTGSNITIQNLDFVTPDKTVVTNLIPGNGDETKTFVFTNNTVTGAFASVLPEIVAGNVTITDNVFTDTHTDDGDFTGDAGNNTCLATRAHTGNFTITGNTFDGYNIAITYNLDPAQATINFENNKFLDNRTDLMFSSKVYPPDFSYNYFKNGVDEAEYRFSIVEPYYTDIECTTLSEPKGEGKAFIVVTNDGADPYMRLLNDSFRLALPASGSSKIEVFAADKRDAVSINGSAVSEAVISATGTATIQVGEKVYSVDVVEGTQSVYADVYLATSLEGVMDPSSKVEMTFDGSTNYEAEIDIPAGTDGDFLYVRYEPEDPTQKVEAITMQNVKGTFEFTCSNNIAKIPYELANAEFGNWDRIYMRLDLTDETKYAIYEIRLTNTTGDATPPSVVDLNTLTGTYSPQTPLEKGSDIELAYQDGKLKSKIVGEYTMSGESTPLSSSTVRYFYNADGAFEEMELTAGYGVNAYFILNQDGTLTLTNDAVFKYTADETTKSGLLPAGTIFVKQN